MPAESHILDGLNLADGTSFVIADVPTFVPAPPRLDWVGGVDSDGTIPVDAGRSDNATLTLPLRVRQQATADLAWQKVGAIVAKLDASRRNRNGLTHLWRPKDMTATWELTVRSGEIAEFPMNDRDAMLGYLRRMHRITIVLHCDPFLYKQGEVVQFTEVTSTEPVFSIVLANVPGHVEAEATVTVTDNATQARRHVEGGLGEDSAAPLLIDSAAMTLLAAASATRTGAYDASGVIRATLATRAQAVCGTGNLGHIGVHRPKARVWASSTAVRLRLAYRTGDSDYSYTPWVAAPVVNAFSEIAFGVVTIGKVTSGAQQWDGRIEAYGANGDTLDIDYFAMPPADRHWKIRTPYLYRVGVIVGRDAFAAITAGTVLNGRVAPSGGTWATSGAATDFAAADLTVGGEAEETMSRATTSDAGRRYGILGSTNYAATEVATAFYATPPPSGSSVPLMGVIARWVDASNHVAVIVDAGEGWSVQKVVAGVTATLISGNVAPAAATWYEMRVVIHASGNGHAWLLDSNGATIQSRAFSDPALATGGTLASGKPGIVDSNGSTGATTRHYDGFYAATPAAEPLAIAPGRSLELRHDSAERQSADGLTWGSVSPQGGRVYVPCAGPEARVTRLWAKARRNDVDSVADDNIADSTKLKVALRPRYRLPTT